MLRKLGAALLLLALLAGACSQKASRSSDSGGLLAAVNLTTATETYGGDTAAPAAPRSVSIFAVGDIMTDRAVGRRIQERGAERILEQVAPELRQADLAFANLENPLSTVGAHDPMNCVFRADPATVAVLTHGGFDIVSLANNHTLDAGRAGLMQTLDHLDEAAILYAGAARERSQASWPRILERNGLRVAFMAFTDLDFTHGSDSKVPSDLQAHCDLIAGVKNKCDLLVVSYHWGQEYKEQPSARQQRLARAVVAAGADVVLGHHPHVLQGIEIHQGRPILYSMGNFVFDQRAGIRMESAIFKLFYTEGEGWLIKVVPVWIPWSRLGPEYPGTAQRDSILTRFAGYCEKLGTPARRVDGTIWVEIPAAARTAVP